MGNTDRAAFTDRAAGDERDRLPAAEFAEPGTLRDALVGAILRGRKTATTSLRAEYEAAGEPLPEAGDRSLLLDSDGRGVAVLVCTAVASVRIADVPTSHVLAEGEGFADVDEWRAAHVAFWTDDATDAVVDDETVVVLESFRVERLLDVAADGDGGAAPTSGASRPE